MEFIPLDSEAQLDEIKNEKGYNILFKHNTTCPISNGVKRRLEQDSDELPRQVPFYILDLLKHRNVSDAIADTFGVRHQSPQLLVIKDGECVYDEALYDISAKSTAEAIEQN